MIFHPGSIFSNGDMMYYFLRIVILFFSIVTCTTAFAAVPTKQPLQKLTVVLDWFVNPDHAPLLVAQQQGFFKAEGLDVNLIAPADPTDPPKLVAIGKADLALDYQPHVLVEQSAGLPIAQVGTLIDAPLSCLAVLADGPIKSIKDLKGKTIGDSMGGVDTAVLQGILHSGGLNLSDVQIINVHYDLTQALLSKRVDAVNGVYRNVELIQLRLAGHPARAFYPEDFGVPPYDEIVFIAQKGKQNDPRIAKFLTAVELGTQYLINHPEASWQATIKEHPELNNQLNHQSWSATLPYFALHPAAKNPLRCQQLAKFLAQNSQIKMNANVCAN